MLEPTGTFSRTSIAGSFQVTGVPAGGANLYPPGTVMDLHLELVSEAIEMTFTAPGDDLDFGTGTDLSNIENSYNALNFKRANMKCSTLRT